LIKDSTLAFRLLRVKKKNISLDSINEVDGWITYAYCPVSKPLEFSVEYIVPDPPKENSSQLLYLFSGIQGGGIESMGRILQPVLQWGISPAGGGNYWAICNWYVFSNGEFFHDSLIKVNSGVELKAVIRRISSENNEFTYESFFEGYSNRLKIINEEQLSGTGYIALETYNVTREGHYPTDEKIRFNNIRIESSTITSLKEWTSYDDWNRPKNDLGQLTKIILNSYLGGIIEINFHSPFSVDKFDEIHFYPNPVKNNLHISPGWIKNILPYYPDKLISKCNIELFDLYGNLLHTRYIELFDYELDLDMSNQRPGIYFIRFSYDDRNLTFKLIKE
jgi:hypothetical protein